VCGQRGETGQSATSTVASGHPQYCFALFLRAAMRGQNIQEQTFGIPPLS
jgi:hypothetical protein